MCVGRVGGGGGVSKTYLCHLIDINDFATLLHEENKILLGSLLTPLQHQPFAFERNRRADRWEKCIKHPIFEKMDAFEYNCFINY